MLAAASMYNIASLFGVLFRSLAFRLYAATSLYFFAYPQFNVSGVTP